MAKQTENKVGIYLRLSQEDLREGDSVSIDNQRMILTKYVKEKGWTLVDTYVDDGWTGTDFNRPEVQRLLDDAKSGRINIIVVKDLSRFGRNYIQVGQYIDYIFPLNNIRFIALNDGVDTADRNSTALEMMPIINLFNEWHASSTSKKSKLLLKQMQGLASTAASRLHTVTSRAMMKNIRLSSTLKPHLWFSLFLR